MKKIITALLVMLALLPAGLEAQGGGRRGMMPPQNRRAVLQRQVLSQFMEQSSRQLGLTAAERGRVEEILLGRETQRQELAEQGAALRRRLMEALRDPDTPDDVFATILNDMFALREREHEMWRREHEEISRALPPRKRAQFAMQMLRLQERIQGIIDQRRLPPDTSR